MLLFAYIVVFTWPIFVRFKRVSLSVSVAARPPIVMAVAAIYTKIALLHKRRIYPSKLLVYNELKNFLKIGAFKFGMLQTVC